MGMSQAEIEQCMAHAGPASFLPARKVIARALREPKSLKNIIFYGSTHSICSLDEDYFIFMLRA